MEIRLGRLEWRGAQASRVLVEKGVDVRIATDLIVGAVNNRYDHAYLLSADGDFSYVIQDAIALGKRVFVATPGESYHLKQVASSYILLGRVQLLGYLTKLRKT